jgi:hypothetical protein
MREADPMHKMIDTPWNTTHALGTLKTQGVEIIGRYYNIVNSRQLPQKCITRSEAEAIGAADLTLLTVFEQGGGTNGNIGDLSAANGERDAARCRSLASEIGQPHGSAIYFTVDYDYFHASDLAKIETYFKAVHAALSPDFKIGCYGSGTVGTTVKNAGVCDLIWLSAARGWSGTRQVLETDQWAILQEFPPVNAPVPYDGDTIPPHSQDVGQFSPT